MKTKEVREVFSRRLQQARLMKGLSLRQLSEAAEGQISHNALAKYERSLMMPDSKILITLSKVLAQPADFFFRPFSVHVGAVHFRRKARLPEKRVAALKELSTNALERYREIEELTGEVRRFTPLFESETIQNVEEGEVLAMRTRQEWNLGDDPIPNMHELLEEKGIKVVELLEDDSAFDGLSASTDVGPVIVLASHLNANVPRKRLTEAHELAHVLLHVSKTMDEKTEEALAYRFAGAFLLPADSFTAAFGQHRTGLSLGELMTLKARFGASMWAIMKRAQQLKLISEHTYKQFCKFAGRNHWRVNGEPDDEKFQGMESDCRYKQLVLRAVAEDLISASKGAALLNCPLDEFRKEFREIVTEGA
jgi:Zn-dependent peptidase ImmA (M78 family)